MGVFGEFIYGGPSVGGDVYGPDIDLSQAQLISSDCVIISLESSVVVDSKFVDVDNYSISIVEGSGQDISIKAIVPPPKSTIQEFTSEKPETSDRSDSFDFSESSYTTRQVLVCIEAPSSGTTYEVSTTNLTGASGETVLGTARFIGRRTKAGSMLKVFPTHFDTRPTSVVSSLITAIGISDDRIGGSRDDDL